MNVTGRLLAAAIIVLSLAVPAWAGAPTDQLRQYTDQVLKILDDPSGTDKKEQVRKVAVQIFDVGETARRALGLHWQTRTPAEREEFTQLFADLLERTYISKIDLYAGEKLQYTKEIVDGDYAVVQSKVMTKRGTDLVVDAKMIKRGDQWLIYDVNIANVSLIGNYRTQFDRIIRTASYQELVRKLKDNRAQFLREKETRPQRTSS